MSETDSPGGVRAGSKPDAADSGVRAPTDDEAPPRPRQVTLVGILAADRKVPGASEPPAATVTPLPPEPERFVGMPEVTAKPRQVTNPGVGRKSVPMPEPRAGWGPSPQDAALLKASHAKTLPAHAAPPASAGLQDDDTSPISGAPPSGENAAARVPEAADAPAFGNARASRGEPPPPPPFTLPPTPVVGAEGIRGDATATAEDALVATDEPERQAMPPGEVQSAAPALAPAIESNPKVVPEDNDAEWEASVRGGTGTRNSRRWKWGALAVVAGGGATAAALLLGAGPQAPLTRAPVTSSVGAPLLPPSSAPRAKPSAPPLPTHTESAEAPSKAMSDDSFATLIRLEKSHDAKPCAAAPASKHGDSVAATLALKAGRKALSQGKPDEALDSFCRATQENPKQANAAISLVQTYLLLGDPARAKVAAENAVERYPSNRKLQELFGDTLARSGDAERAVSVWLEFMHLQRGDAQKIQRVASKYVNLAARAFKAADKAQADRLYRRAALLDPESALASLGLARVFLARQETNAAVGWARRAVRLAPSSADAQLLLGDAETKAGNADVAKRAYEDALRLDPKDDRVRARLGLDH